MVRYDVVIVGARPAGAATAMLLARAGLRVIVVDRARFPSDTLSTHQVQLPGVACLRRWGMLDGLVATGAPPTRTVRFDPGTVVLTGSFPHHEGVDAVVSPRRTVLDALLIDAARAAGAEVLTGFDVEEVVAAEGVVVGIRGRQRGSSQGASQVIQARLVIGADGKHSTLARLVGAGAYDERPPMSAGAYAYWSGLPTSDSTGERGEIYVRDRRMVSAWPTNDGLTITYVAVPAGDFDAFRSDLEHNVRTALDSAGDLGERARAATRVEHIRATPDLPNAYRRPYGPGWALVGDAGLVMDPISGQGIGHALLDAESLAAAVVDGLGGPSGLTTTLAAHHAARDRRTRPMYRLTTDVASFRQRAGGDVLFSAIGRRPEQIQAFLGVLTGVVPVDRFFSGRNLGRLVGLRGMLAIATSQVRQRRPLAV
jgi:2-polyprenyl-6-methoxyphenol hydroxylase-like FAD-dependent oxidoreductase